MRRRFLRRGGAYHLTHEQMTEDGTMVFGAIWCSDEDANDWSAEIQSQTGIPEQFIFFDEALDRLEIPLMLAEQIADVVDAPVAMVEVHPTHERLEVGVVWLNDLRP